MSDSLSDYLVDRDRTSDSDHQKLFVIRYVPYGPLRDVMPYLASNLLDEQSRIGVCWVMMEVVVLSP